MNHIVALNAQLISKDAEIEWLRKALAEIRATGLNGGYTSEQGNTGYVNGGDIARKCEQALTNAEVEADLAYFNEIGPEPADGSHWNKRYQYNACSHPATQTVVNGWHCGECGESMVSSDWNDTEVKARERMRQHWISSHKEKSL